MIEMVAYDADGCLFDTRAMIMGGYTEVAATHGLTAPTFEAVSELMGKPIPDVLAGLFPNADYGSLLVTISEYAKKYATTSQPYKDIGRLLTGINALGIRQAVVTSGGSRIDEQLLVHGLSGFFSSVVHAERVTMSKPHPEGLELALHECQAEAASTIMVGDMPDDILMGKAARVRATIGVSHGFSKAERLKAAGADYIVASLGELSVVLHELHSADK